ncbi:ATP-dependent helicase, partial [Pseudomonas aeruginosa]
MPGRRRAGREGGCRAFLVSLRDVRRRWIGPPPPRGGGRGGGPGGGGGGRRGGRKGGQRPRARRL